MAHMLATTRGKVSFAYTGEPGWHGLGNNVTKGATLEKWLEESGLSFTVKRAFVRYATSADASAPLMVDKNNVVLFADDNGSRLGIVSPQFKVVQPLEIMEGFRDLTEKFGYEIETAGAIKGRTQIWVLAKGPGTAIIGDTFEGDRVNDYLLCYTSFDGSRRTGTKKTKTRVVCNNTLTEACSDGLGHMVSHRSKWSAKDAHRALGVGEFSKFAEQANLMANTKVTPEQQVPFLLTVYHNMTVQQLTDAEAAAAKGDTKAISTVKSVTKTFARLSDILVNAPGQQMKSAKDTLWGLLNGVTFDIDHAKPAHTQENRLESSWFGAGEGIKNAAWDLAMSQLKESTLMTGSYVSVAQPTAFAA